MRLEKAIMALLKFFSSPGFLQNSSTGYDGLACVPYQLYIIKRAHTVNKEVDF